MRPLVCLHGFTGRGESWRGVLSRLPEGADAVCPDLLGHGGASSAESFEQEVDRLASELERRSFREGVLAGYSLGARIGLGLLVRHPGLFVRAVLVGSQPGLEDEKERRARLVADEHLARRLEQEGIERFLEDWESLPLFATQIELPAEIRAAQRAARLRHDPQELARSLRVLGLGRMPDLWPELPALDLPVRLVAGERDEKFCAIAYRMAEHLPRATVEIVAGAGHNVGLERPDALAAILTEELRA